MSWALAIALALLGFATAAFVLRVPKAAWPTLGAALAFGLAGYALQASPGVPGAPAGATAQHAIDGSALIEARRRVLAVADRPLAPYVLTADAFARRGQYTDAARLLGAAVREHPRDAEAWIALGNALVEHGEGSLSPAALYAYRRAAALEPQSAGPAFFLGLALIRQGALVDAHRLWSGQLDAMPAGAPGRDELAERYQMLDEAMRRIAADAPRAPSAR